MLTTRMTECIQCGDILTLISEIDCKITEIGGKMYNSIVYALNPCNSSCDADGMGDLLNYRRILVHKWCNNEYTEDFTVEQIASKVKLMTSGCIPQECCDTCPPVTTTTTTTVSPTTTTTTTI